MPGAEPTPKTLQEVSSTVYPKLERVPGKQNWVDKAGGLPSYIERIAKHLHFEKGKDIGTAIAIAVNTVKRWATGTNHNGSKLKPDTVAKAQAAVAEWEAKKAKGKLKEAAETECAEELDAELRASLAGVLLHRLSLAEGFQAHLKGSRTRGKSGALTSANALLEGSQPKMTLGRGTVDPVELARTQSRLGVEISELRATLSSLDLAEAMGVGDQPAIPPQQGKKAKGRSGKSLSFDESKHPRASKGRTGGGQFIRAGASGPQVKGIQRKLGIKADGKFGKKTQKAVRDYQQAHDLTVDGVVGAQTAAALNGAEAIPGPLLGHHRKAMKNLKADSSSRYSAANLAKEDAAEKARNKVHKAAKEAKKDAESSSSSSSSSTSTPSTGPGSVLESGSTLPKRIVDLIQRKLGLDTSGGYDEKTKARIEAFQKEHGLAVDGIVGTQTLAALRGDESPPAPGGFSQADWEWLSSNQAGGQRDRRRAKQKQTQEARENKREGRVEKQLSEGADEKKKPVVEDDHHRGYGAGMTGAPDEATGHLQNRLAELGYDVGPADGRYGERTKDAVEAFQGEHSLKEDGEVGPNTKVALRGTNPDEVARRRGSSKAEESAEEAEEQESPAEDTTETTEEGETAPMPKLAGAVLTKGAGTDSEDPDPAVMAMQKATGAEEDGWFGPASEKKLKATQRKYGLKADGVVGPKTGKLLDRLNTAGDAKASKEEKALAEAVLARQVATVEGDSTAIVRARARERLARSVLQEASLRGAAGDALRDFYRLDDGTFAPKGLGRVLRPGEEINLPKRDGKGTVRAKIEAGEGGKGLARLLDGPDKGRLAGVRTAPPANRKPHHFPKALKSRPTDLPSMKRNAGWGERDRYDKLNSEARAQSNLDQMNHYIATGDEQGVQDHVDDAKGEADHYNQFSGNAGKRWEELEARGNHFLEHGTSPDAQRAPAEAPKADEGAQLDKAFEEAMADPQRAPIDFSSASDSELDSMMNEATSHMEGAPMTARDRSIFRGIIQERTRRAKKELSAATSPSMKEKAASLIAQLTGKRPEEVPQPQYAPPEGFQPNSSDTQIKDMAPGDTFYIGKYDMPFVLHKSVGGQFVVAKPVGGGKAQPFHEEMAPAFLGPHDDTYPAPGAASAAPANDSDLYDKLKASVEGGGSIKDKIAAMSTEDTVHGGLTDAEVKAAGLKGKGGKGSSPARSAKGNLRNFKAMTTPKLVALAEEMKAHPEDVEAVKAITAEMKTRSGSDLPADEPVTVIPKSEPEKGFKIPPAPAEAPKTAEPAKNKSADEKIASAWGAYEKKKAEFDALPKDASKEERAKKASQVRAAKFRIKRVGGDFEAGPPAGGDDTPAPKVKASKPKKMTLGEKMKDSVDQFAAGKGVDEIPLSAAEVKNLVNLVPAGGYDAAQASGKGMEALITLNRGEFKDLLAGLEKVEDKDLARLYLTAEDANFHTLNEKVGDELDARGIQYPELEQVASGVSPEDAMKNSQAAQERQNAAEADFQPGQKVQIADVPEGEFFYDGPNNDLWEVIQQGPHGTTVNNPVDSETQVWPDKTVEYADQKASKKQAKAFEAIPADEGNLTSTAGILGGAWSTNAVQAALDQLEEQGLTFDRENESPDTLAAVIKAAGLDPANLKTQGTV